MEEDEDVREEHEDDETERRIVDPRHFANFVPIYKGGWRQQLAFGTAVGSSREGASTHHTLADAGWTTGAASRGPISMRGRERVIAGVAVAARQRCFYSMASSVESGDGDRG